MHRIRRISMNNPSSSMGVGSAKLGVYSLNETGIARIIFNSDFSSFDGVLVNFHDETFQLSGRAHRPSGSSNELYQSVLAAQSQPINMHATTSSSAPVDILTDDMMSSTHERIIDMTVVEGETGNQYHVRRVRVHTEDSNQNVELNSEHCRFRTDDILIGMRADMEIRQYMNVEMGATGRPVHMGKMTISFQAALTPPPTPSSHIDENSQTGLTGGTEPMDECNVAPDDFMA